MRGRHSGGRWRRWRRCRSGPSPSGRIPARPVAPTGRFHAVRQCPETAAASVKKKSTKNPKTLNCQIPPRFGENHGFSPIQRSKPSQRLPSACGGTCTQSLSPVLTNFPPKKKPDPFGSPVNFSSGVRLRRQSKGEKKRGASRLEHPLASQWWVRLRQAIGILHSRERERERGAPFSFSFSFPCNFSFFPPFVFLLIFWAAAW